MIDAAVEPMHKQTSPQPAPILLSDDEVVTFVIRGYHVVQTDFPAEFHRAIYDKISQLKENPGDGILDCVPELHQVYDHPAVRGALISLLGQNYAMNSHRHCHMNKPGTRSQDWHQDGTNQRHHHVRTVLGMYYPQDVTADMGPTVVLPGTHFRNAPTDRMASYANFREQVVFNVPAGTVAITHYDIWHAASANTSQKMRYMCKFLFDRVDVPEPTQPSWNHDPAAAAKAENRLTFERAVICSQSDHYKERDLRHEMWHHLLGRPQT
jgi:Phytanoyl-CoA dioxygenase (PhyH)